MKLILILIFSHLFSQKMSDLAEETIKTILPNYVILQRTTVDFQQNELLDIEKRFRQVFYKRKFHVWHCSDSLNNERYVVMDHVIGKVQAISFILVFTPNSVIDFVEVLKYRESHGHEIQRRSFLQQFENSNDSVYIVGSTIKNIAGATISVHSISKGISKLRMLFPLIKKRIHDQLSTIK